MPLPVQQPVYLVDGTRTPFSHHIRRDSLGEVAYTPQDLIHITARSLLSQHSLKESDIDNLVMASSNTIDCAQLAETAAIRLRCNTFITPKTFLGSDKSGLQALLDAYHSIASQGKSLVLLGGVETISAPIISMSDELAEWLQAWRNASGPAEKTKVFNTLHTRYFRQRSQSTSTPEHLFTLQQGKAESVAGKHAIGLEAQAEYVNLSQRRLKYAQRNNTLCDITPVYYSDGSSVSVDENLITLDPESLKQALQTNPDAAGLITHSSVAQTTEGACCLLLASQACVDEYQLTPLAKLSEPIWSTDDLAIETSLKNHELTVADIDYWEWDETSAAEMLAFKQKAIYQSLNSFDQINLDGGALALGNPYAAGQLRSILQLSHTLKRNNGHHGLCHFGFSDNKTSAVMLNNIEEADS